MKPPAFATLQSVFEPFVSWATIHLDDIQRLYGDLERAIVSIGFGDGTVTDNVLGKWVEVTFHVTPGTEVAITHNLGVIPIGFLLVIPPTSGVVNKGTTAWTTTTLYLSCTVSLATARIFVLPATPL